VVHLLEIALAAEPQNLAALKTKHVALYKLLVSSGNVNLSGNTWLILEIAAVEAGAGMTKVQA